MLPTTTFIRVGESLSEESSSASLSLPSLTHECPQQQELLEEETKLTRNHHNNSNSKKNRILSTSIQNEELKIKSNDIDEDSRDINMKTNKRKMFHHHLSTKNIISNGMICFLSIITMYLIRELYMSQIRETKLTSKLDEEIKRNERLVQRLLNNKVIEEEEEEELQQHVSVCFEPRSNEKQKQEQLLQSQESQFSSMTIADNCYFSIQTSVSFGECGINLKNDLSNWYEDTISYVYSNWWDDFLGSMEDEYMTEE